MKSDAQAVDGTIAFQVGIGRSRLKKKYRSYEGPLAMKTVVPVHVKMTGWDFGGYGLSVVWVLRKD